MPSTTESLDARSRRGLVSSSQRAKTHYCPSLSQREAIGCESTDARCAPRLRLPPILELPLSRTPESCALCSLILTRRRAQSGRSAGRGAKDAPFSKEAPYYPGETRLIEQESHAEFSEGSASRKIRLAATLPSPRRGLGATAYR
jgi:hypothetical protein